MGHITCAPKREEQREERTKGGRSSGRTLADCGRLRQRRRQRNHRGHRRLGHDCGDHRRWRRRWERRRDPLAHPTRQRRRGPALCRHQRRDRRGKRSIQPELRARHQRGLAVPGPARHRDRERHCAGRVLDSRHRHRPLPVRGPDPRPGRTRRGRRLRHERVLPRADVPPDLRSRDGRSRRQAVGSATRRVDICAVPQQRPHRRGRRRRPARHSRKPASGTGTRSTRWPRR